MGNSGSSDPAANKGSKEEKNEDPDAPQCCRKQIDKLKPAFDKMKKQPCGVICGKILYSILAIIVIILGLSVLVVAATTAFATSIYYRIESLELLDRLIAMILLAVTAAIALTMAIYGFVGVCSGKTKALFAAAMVLLVVALIQAIIAGVSVDVNVANDQHLVKALKDSFQLARQNNPRHLRIWATTQSDLNCCGAFSAEDYRTPNTPTIFPPDVPISCCPTYAPDRSPLVQERERETCKARREYYDIGCKVMVVEVFRNSATMVLGVVIPIIIFEVLLALVSICLSREKKGKDSAPASAEEGNSKSHHQTPSHAS